MWKVFKVNNKDEQMLYLEAFKIVADFLNNWFF